MAIEIKMPALSPTMEEGTLARWLKSEGDKIEPGDIIAEIETDKATMEFEAIDEGVLTAILVPEGTESVKVGETIARLDGEDENSETEDEASAGGVSEPSSKNRAESVVDQDKQSIPQALDEEEGKKISVRDALRDAMAEEMRLDDRVFIMGEEVAEYQGAYKVTQGLLEEFGAKRVIDTPITEYGFAGIGAGAAMGGLRPVVEFMTFNFAMQAIDHIINSAAKTNYMSGGQMRCPVVFRGPNGAASRVGAQHSQNYGPWYASVPGLVVLAPYASADAKGLLKSAIRSDDPVVFLENELVYGRNFSVPEGDEHIVPIGKASVVREGRDVTIVSYSIGVGFALDAAEILSENGIEAEVIDLRTLRPLDKETVLTSLSKTNRVIVAEEGWPTCSISSEVAAICMEEGFDDLDAPVTRVCNEDVPLPYAANLETLALVNANKIVEAAKKVCYRK